MQPRFVLPSFSAQLVDLIRDLDDRGNSAIARYIDGFYNPVRRHSALDFTSPAQFEKMAAE